MKSIRQLRSDIYSNVKQRRPYIFEKWKWYYYRKFKALLYIEGASVFAYIFIKLSIKPNVVTLIYLLMGLFGGILIALPSKISVVIGIVFFYFRGIFDWADGVVARETKCTSVDGAVMDSYGALVGWVSLWAGLGFYLGNSTSSVFRWLVPIIPALFAVELWRDATLTIIFHRLTRSAKNQAEKSGTAAASNDGALRKIKDFIDHILEHNARTVDFIVLMVLIELFTTLRILWLFYSAFMVWQAAIFIIRLVTITRGGWAEREIERLKEYI